MEVSKYIEIVSEKKGANLKAEFKKDLKVRKNAGEVSVQKVTKCVVRGGIQYDNMKAVQEGREDGTKPEENAGLPWGEWKEYPYHIAHKAQDFLRIYPASGIEFKPKVTYFMDGEEVDMEVVMPLCLASEFDINKKNWIIQDGELYWSNENGWGDKKDATKFKGSEKDELNLPIGDAVKWVKIEVTCFTIKADNLVSIG